jgi:outer membrane receptor protein involved in Fe transport
VEGTVGDNGRRSLGLAVGGPLHETRPEQLTFRLALHQHADDGFRRNRTVNRDTNARDEFDARLRVRWQPREVWTWDVTLVGGSTRNGFDDFALDNNGRYTFSDQPGQDHQEALAGSLRGTGEVGASTRLTTLTTWLSVDSTYSYDDDWTDASYMGFSALDRERRTFTQELRLDGETDTMTERWTIGLHFAVNDEDGAYTNTDPWNIRGLTTTYGAKHLSLFGQTAHRLGPVTRLTLGLRGERVDLHGTGQRTRFRAGPPSSRDPVVNVAPRFADTLWGGKVTLEHELSPAWQGFASIASGYKVGGINIDARINPLVDPLTYDTEHLWNFEAGLRGQALDDRLRGSVTLFQLDRRDTQVRDSAGFGGSYRFFTDNGQRARHYGLEAEGAWQIAGEWTLRGHLALLHGTIDAFTLSNGNKGGDRRLANTPSHGYGLGLHYAPPRGFFAGADLNGRASFYESNNHDEKRSAFTLVHATVGYAWERWTLSLWVRNVFDARHENRVFFFGNDEAIDYAERRYESRADPRHFGVTLSGRW